MFPGDLRGNIAAIDERWHWIEFLGREIRSGANGRRTLLGWAGSATVAVALASWTLLGLMELVPANPVQFTVLGLAFAGFLVARAVSALYPGGIGGLVDEVLGAETDADVGIGPLVDFIFVNLPLVRSRVLTLALADTFPTILLVILAFSTIPLPAGAIALLWILIGLRLVVFAFYASFMLLFFSEPTLVRSAAERAERVANLLENNPRIAKIVLKFLFLERLGSVSTNLLYYGGQFVMAAWIVGSLAGSTFVAARLILLGSVIAILSAIVWELWKRAKESVVLLSHMGDLRDDVLLGEIAPETIGEEYLETLKEIRVDLAAPFILPDSVWKARGETPPRN